MEFSREITVPQLTAILINAMVGVEIFHLPQYVIRSAGTSAPLTVILGSLLALAGLLTWVVLGMRYPRQSVFRYGESLIGRWPARFFHLCLLLLFAVLTALAAREFGEVVITYILRRTPVEVTVLVMLVLAALPTRNDLNSFAYIQLFYLPLILVPLPVILVTALKDSEVYYVQPFWSGDLPGILGGMLGVAGLFQAGLILTAVMPAMRKPRQAKKAVLWSVGVTGGIYLMVVTVVLAFFGEAEARLILWPTMEFSKAVVFPGDFLERLDALFLVAWVIAVFTTLFSGYYLTVHGLAHLFRLRDHRPLSLFVLPVIYGLAMFAQNVLQVGDFVRWVGKSGLILSFGYPLLLLLFHGIRSKGGKRDAEKTASST
ncbi:spore germination protein [Desmospora sp. 8437]|nr:spore germination protein [Desmospora sp. 8437]